MPASFPLLSRLCRLAAQALPTMLGIVILNFLLLQLVPGDAADVLAAESGSATAELMAQWRARFGLDQGLFTQLAHYLLGLARLDLGESLRYQTPVAGLIASRLPGTLQLMLSAWAIALAAGMAAGVVMASCAGRWPDRLLSAGVLVLYSMPGFWVGLMAVVGFAVHLGWFPSGGSFSAGSDLQGWSAWTDRAWHLALPALALSTFFVAIYARLTRAAMLEMAGQDFVRTARAKGVGPVAVQLRHVLRNALIPVTTVAGLHIGNLLGGSVVIETVFGWPGMGSLALEAVMARDFRLLLGVLLLASLVVIVANVLVDLLHAAIDPRMSVASRAATAAGG